MTHILNIEVPDEIYHPLQARAHAAGQTVEDWARNRLKAEIEEVEIENGASAQLEAKAPIDPLARFIGGISSQDAHRDWADEHDKYLAEPLERELSAQNADEQDKNL